MSERFDVTWALPFVAPFVLIGLARVVFFVAGAEWTDPALGAFFGLIVGLPMGCLGAAALYEAKKPITIRKFWVLK